MDQLEEIKNKIDLVNFISEYLPLKKAGRNFKALCPFHSEKTPSFVVSPERQIWHCFGCNAGGDLFGFLMKMENMEFVEAMETLAKRVGIQLRRGQTEDGRWKIKERIYQLNHLASEFYHWLLLNHASGQPALNYVLGRGVNKKSLATFSLGWAPNSWNSLSNFLLKKGYSLPEIETAGLVIRNQKSEIRNPNFYDRFRGRLIFTLKDQRSNVVGFAGRTLDPTVKEAKYINTPETPVYVKGNLLYGLDVTKEAIKKEDRAVIVEGEFDLIASFQAGVANVVAIKGSALTEGQTNLLKRYSQNISLALDMDIAGDAAVKRGIETADQAGLSITVIKLPVGKDPDECVKTNPSLWQKAVKEPVPVFDYFLDSAISRYGQTTAEGKRKIGDEVLPVLAKIANPIVQSHYLGKLAGVLAVSEEVLVQTIKKLVKQEIIRDVVKTLSVNVSSPGDRRQLLEEELLAYVLQSEEPAAMLATLKLEGIGEFLSTPALKKILFKLEEFLAKNPALKMTDFIKALPSELVPLADRAYLVDLGEILTDKKIFAQQLAKTLKEIKKLFFKSRLLSLAEQSKIEKGDRLDQIREEYQRTTAELKKCQS